MGRGQGREDLLLLFLFLIILPIILSFLGGSIENTPAHLPAPLILKHNYQENLKMFVNCSLRSRLNNELKII